MGMIFSRPLVYQGDHQRLGGAERCQAFVVSARDQHFSSICAWLEAQHNPTLSLEGEGRSLCAKKLMLRPEPFLYLIQDIPRKMVENAVLRQSRMVRGSKCKARFRFAKPTPSVAASSPAGLGGHLANDALCVATATEQLERLVPHLTRNDGTVCTIVGRRPGPHGAVARVANCKVSDRCLADGVLAPWFPPVVVLWAPSVDFCGAPVVPLCAYMYSHVAGWIHRDVLIKRRDDLVVVAERSSQLLALARKTSSLELGQSAFVFARVLQDRWRALSRLLAAS